MENSNALLESTKSSTCITPNNEIFLLCFWSTECKEWRVCASTPFPLTFNYEQHCIPGVLKTIIWHLHGPQNSAMELQSPAGDLRYCPPEDKCNSIILLNVSHVNSGITLGQFCPKGTIQKIQIRESKIAILPRYEFQWPEFGN